MNSKITPLVITIIGALCFGGSFVLSNSSNGGLDVEIDKTAFIMPAVHRVYANEDALNGKYYLFKAKITNNSDATLEDVTVKYRIPDYIDWTELTVSGEMFPGQTLVIPCYPKFKDDITQKTTESIEKTEIEISWDGADEDDIIEEVFSFKLTNRNEYVYTGIKKEEISTWTDMFDNDDLLACFVTPNDPVVKYYTQNLQEKLMKGEQATVSQKPEDGVKFLAGIYKATVKSHMVYSGTKGIPQSTDDVASMIQQVRLPREVITGNTGLCIELSCFYASVLSAAGLDPIIYLIPGHAYPGFKMNGQYYAIEATGIGGEGLGGVSSVEKAFEQGQKQLQEFIQRQNNGDSRYIAVDIHALNQEGATAMDLKDNDFMKKKVDDIVASWSGGKPVKVIDRKKRKDNDIIIPNPPIISNNALSFTIPNGWQTMMRPVPQMPILTAQVLAPDQMTTVSIYDIAVSNSQQAMSSINQYMLGFGMEMQYQINGNLISGQTHSLNGTFNWVGKTIRINNGIRVIAVGTPEIFYNQNSSIINQVYNSIK